MEVQDLIYSFDDVRKGISLPEDPYGIGKYTLEKNIVDTFLSAPACPDGREPMIHLTLVDGKIAGRNMLYPSRMKVGNEIVPVTSGSSLHVEEKFRHMALGVNLMMFPLSLNRCPLYAGLSNMAEPLYKKLKYAIFRIPKMWQIRRVRPILQSFGLKGLLLTFVSFCIDIILSILVSCGKLASQRSGKGFRIEKLNQVPKWAEDIVLADKHKYAELHDQKWMQWVLDHNFFGRKEDKQMFYGIYKNDQPIAFLLLAERNFPIPGKNIDKCVYGYVLEWDTKDSSVIDELQLKTIAMGLFSGDVDIVQIDSQKESVIKSMKKYGFIRHGYENIGFKDTTKKFGKDWKNENNWRLRASYSDRPFY